MRLRPASLAMLLLLALPAPSFATTLVVDAMTDPIPPNICLPVSHQPVLFVGRLCDGEACRRDCGWIRREIQTSTAATSTSSPFPGSSRLAGSST